MEIFYKTITYQTIAFTVTRTGENAARATWGH